MVVRYVGDNPNGSARDIAGICNERGNVVGLMPHPEHAIEDADRADRPTDSVLHVRPRRRRFR